MADITPSELRDKYHIYAKDSGTPATQDTATRLAQAVEDIEGSEGTVKATSRGIIQSHGSASDPSKWTSYDEDHPNDPYQMIEVSDDIVWMYGQRAGGTQNGHGLVAITLDDSAQPGILLSIHTPDGNDWGLRLGLEGNIHLGNHSTDIFRLDVPTIANQIRDNGVYAFLVNDSSGALSQVVKTVPLPPTDNGDYHLHVENGVTTWVAN